jgi:hypothetical protein
MAETTKEITKVLNTGQLYNNNNNNNNILLPGRSEAYAVISQSYLQAGQKHTKTLPLFAKRRAFSIP